MQNGLHDVPAGKVATVVTHLEMRAPQTRGVPLPEGLTFEPISPDLHAYRDLFRRVGQDWLWYFRLTLSDDDLSAILNDPAVHIFTLMQEDTPQALLELDFRQPDACELAYFGLTPALIGTGAGAYLMDQAVTLAFAAPITRFHVHTCTLDSPQALAFYIRSGFSVTRQQIEIDEDPRLAGLLPDTSAPHIPLIRPKA